jgi:L-ascorbate metabolism protein UlaG (beta-lactamase superfamily)
VLGPLGHVGAGLKYMATARRQHASDLLTARQLPFPSSVALPHGLQVTWLGTAGFRFEYEGVVVWIDPYVTRLRLADVVMRRVIAPSEDAVATWIDRADAILVGHTHFDHAMDVPAIARRTGCPVYGSSSLERLMGLHGLAQLATVVVPHVDYEVGPFRFHFVPSLHSKLQLGLRVNYGGELTCEHLDEMIPQAYRCGQVFGVFVEVAGTSFYHAGSADLIEDEIKDRGVDVFLCGIAGRRFTPNYVQRVVRALAPKLVVPSHFDDFFRPVGDGKLSFNVNLTGFADEVHAVSHELPIGILEVGQPIGYRNSRGT